MAKQSNIELEGEVIAELGNSMFSVKVDNITESLLCTISGRIRKNFIKIITGDRVRIEVSPYDLTKGRITARLKVKQS